MHRIYSIYEMYFTYPPLLSIISQGIVEVTSEQTSESYEPLFHYIEDLEEKLRTNAIQVPEKEEKVKKLIEAHADHY